MIRGARSMDSGRRQGAGRPDGRRPQSRHAAQQRRQNHSGALIALLVVVLVLGVGFVAFRYFFSSDDMQAADVEPGIAVTVTIPDGSNGTAILQILLQEGVVQDASAFRSEVNAQNAESSLKSGTYDFVTCQDVSEVVAQLVEGPNSTYGQVTIAEGLTVTKTAEQVESVLGISQEDFLAQAKASNYVDTYSFLEGVADDSLEGFLYGKTYDASSDVSADHVIDLMLQQYQLEVASLDFAAGEQLIYERYGVELDDYEVLILASIVEKEALTDDDRVNIASVFLNRLQAGMYLQSDATMSYVTGGDVTATDLSTDSPYNTYLYAGLTPTPICSPSLASIEAVLNPADTDYYYFWITQDEHVFSETYEQHQEAIANATS